MKSVLLPLLIVAAVTVCVAEKGGRKKYCLIGAGPGGLQTGYFLERSGRDYIIFEKSYTAGAFYTLYPRHRTLISINKRFTGKDNKEFNFRHDWNSLISDDPTLRMTLYTEKYFPDADTIVQYFSDFARKMKLNIQYHTEIVDVSREGMGDFKLRDQNGTSYHCQILIVSTGIWVPNIPSNFRGLEHSVGYESMSLNQNEYENKAVLILGRGNAGFETANHLSSHAAFVHLTSRGRVKNAYQTHYVGDLRAINNNILDGYQLKSLDGLFEANLASELQTTSLSLVKDKEGKIYLQHPDALKLAYLDSLALDKSYDVVIRCLGFKFDFSIFNETARPEPHPTAGENKYPNIKPSYESTNVPDMFFAGTNTHGRDFRKSAGAFIHGFRYTARALFHHLQWRYEGIPWPSVTLPVSDLQNYLTKRINEASANYQMFGMLVDVALIRDNNTVVYLEEVPLQGMYMFKELTGHEIGSFFIWNFEYGPYYSGADKDVLRKDRFSGNPVLADQSNFLHPVLYYWKNPPRPDSTWISGSLPPPDLYHHLVEDFYTDWSYRRCHQIPLRRFLEGALQTDLRHFFAETCFELILTQGSNIPISCKQHYLQGVGIPSSDEYLTFGPPEAFTH